MKKSLPANTTISHYRILSHLGTGGMGKVYLAEDTRLRRKVALKILSAELIKNENRLRRFEQEAFAASALSHPNILVIHEIGTEGNTHFIATEYIEGDTLRQRIRHRKFSLRDALEVAIQAASALSAAHKAGIVHRDIKPENIMLREDGYVKVLDFGLAKLAERQAPSTDTEAQTIAKVDTDPGTVVGTINYMSPEQARAKSVDPRTDVFSLATVIYEMIAGRPAFEGESSTDVLAAILDKDPPPLARFAPETPAELQRIVSKSLCKDKEERYQTIKDLLIDLKNLREELTFEEKLERSVSPDSSGQMSVTTSSGAAAPTSSQFPAAQSNEAIAGRTTSSAEVILNEIKRHKAGVAASAVALLLFAAGAGYLVYRLVNKESAARPFQSFKITRLTNTGTAVDAVISPDGRYVVHAVHDFGKQSLWVRQVNTTSNVQIVPPAEVRYLGMTFSRDGDYVYYVTREGVSPQGNLFQIPVLGGTPRKLIEDIDTPPGFSPDQKRLSFIRNVTSESHLVVSNADGSSEQNLATLKRPDSFLYNQARGPAWSPDGKIIVCGIERTDTSGSYHTVGMVSASDGTVKTLTASRWNSIRRMAWLADGTGLLMVAGDTPANAESQQVFYVSYPEGSVRQVTNDLNNYYGMSLKADSSAFATVQRVAVANIWVAPATDTSSARQISFGGSKVDGIGGLAFAPDGRIVYFSNAGGNPDLWSMSPDGSAQRHLISNARLPAVSRDGHYVAFISSRTGANYVWRMDPDGGNLKQLSSEIVDDIPDFSSDSRWVLIALYNSYAIIKVSVDGTESVQLTEGQIVYASQVSPDGKLMACSYRESLGARYQLAIFSFEGGKPLKAFDLPRTAVIRPYRWAPDGRAIHYIVNNGGVSNIWSQPVDGGPPKQLTNFKSDLIFWFDWSRDGKQLALSRGTLNSDVVLISESK